MITGRAQVGLIPVSVSIMDFTFMGGSMGSVVGEKIARALLDSLKYREAAIILSRSGGARMQESLLSLMQMAKTSAVLARLRNEGIPFISLLTNPTTGGVTASYATLGDINVAEPGALIGFARAQGHQADHRGRPARGVPVFRVPAGTRNGGRDQRAERSEGNADQDSALVCRWPRCVGASAATRLTPHGAGPGKSRQRTRTSG